MSTRIIIAILTMAGLTACGPDPVFKGDHGNEFKPVSSIADDPKFSATGASGDVVATVSYGLSVTARSGAELCTGDVTIKIMGDFNMQFPEAVVHCLSLEIDLASMLGAQAGGAAGGFTTGQGAIQHDGFTLSMKSLGGAEFDPPRPLLLGPIFQDPDKYKGYEKTTHHKMTYKDESGQSVTKEGDFSIKVKKFATDYKNTIGDKTVEFHDVLWWEMTSNFDTPAKNGLTFKKWEWYWNMRPLMIPGFKIEGTIGDFASGDGIADAQELTGTMTFELFVKDYKFE